jgi:CspA family cold shock protein
MNTIHIGVVRFFNVGRLYGFITDDETGKDYFCHNNGLSCHIKKGDRVIFELADCPKGIEAIKLLYPKLPEIMNLGIGLCIIATSSFCLHLFSKI